ncbi:hypothetical protein DFJ74DRAFT_473229 [Hyaloraphidium curvatum]|nr:hypothetical protein DFJ74DRAFT_473229 [Hyaloraphidium curvatum]
MHEETRGGAWSEEEHSLVSRGSEAVQGMRPSCQLRPPHRTAHACFGGVHAPMDGQSRPGIGPATLLDEARRLRVPTSHLQALSMQKHPIQVREEAQGCRFRVRASRMHPATFCGGRPPVPRGSHARKRQQKCCPHRLLMKGSCWEFIRLFQVPVRGLGGSSSVGGRAKGRGPAAPGGYPVQLSGAACQTFGFLSCGRHRNWGRGVGMRARDRSVVSGGRRARPYQGSRKTRGIPGFAVLRK